MPERRLAVVVLAAGQGTRMKSETPKVLHRLAGVPLLGHVLNTAEALEPEHIAVVLRHGRDTIAQTISEQFPELLIVDQDEIPGTGRAAELALAALPEGFDGEVLILSADVPLMDSETLNQLIEEHISAQNSLSVVTATVNAPTGFGRIIRNESAEFVAIVEERDAAEEQRKIREINSGVYIASIRELATALSQIDTNNAQAEKYLTDSVQLIAQSGGRVAAVQISDPWLIAGINDRSQLAEVAQELNARIIRGWQLAGVTINDPANTWIDLTVTLEADVEILPGSQLLGATYVASGAVIGPDTTLRDTEVGSKAKVNRTDATLAVIGSGASVGPFAYLRPGSYLGEDGKIGAFVETKNAKIGAGSKVPHLSYVGDAVIGTGSNIGAGTIFANYDGIQKHQTQIGDNTKTGANNTFVAPVEIGSNVYTGAGSVIRKAVPDGALAVTNSQQRIFEGWVEKNRKK